MNPIHPREAGLDPDRNRPYPHRVYPVRQPVSTVGKDLVSTTTVKLVADATYTPTTSIQEFLDKVKSQAVVYPSLEDMSTNAVKHDDGKTDWSLVPFEALEGMADVLTFGARKYDSWNWTSGGGFQYLRVLRSCLRHLFAFMRGEDNDPESGLSHISHAQCNLLFLAFYIRNKDKYNKDDRYVR